MLKFTVHTGNLNEILSSQINNAANKAELAVAQQVLSDTDPFVPARTLSLSTRSHTDPETAEDQNPLYERAEEETKKAINAGKPVVIYPGPYARFLYYGKLMIDPNTGSSWVPKGGTKEVTGKDLQYSKIPHGQAQDHWFEASKAQNLDEWIRVADKAVKKDLGKE